MPYSTRNIFSSTKTFCIYSQSEAPFRQSILLVSLFLGGNKKKIIDNCQLFELRGWQTVLGLNASGLRSVIHAIDSCRNDSNCDRFAQSEQLQSEQYFLNRKQSQ